MDNSFDIPGLLGRLFGGQPATAGAPMDVRPAGLQQTMGQQQPQQTGGTYNPMGDIGWRMMAAGQRMTPQQRQQIVGSIPGAVAQNYYADQMRQHPMQPDQPAGLLGNGAPMTPAMAQGNNDVWSNMGKGLNADGTPNTGVGFPGANQLQEEINRYRQPIAGASGYGLY